ncbi:MAG: hypothetical protein H8Z69_05070 [Nanohaloarchaea archaeon]|nr:hypothetical protein [Candidatus Nanohaloarchaea archaeon]
MSSDPDIYDLVISFEDLFDSYEPEEAYSKSKEVLHKKGFAYGPEMHMEKSPRLRENLESEHEEYKLSVHDDDLTTDLKFILEDGRKESDGNYVEIV